MNTVYISGRTRPTAGTTISVRLPFAPCANVVHGMELVIMAIGCRRNVFVVTNMCSYAVALYILQILDLLIWITLLFKGLALVSTFL